MWWPLCFGCDRLRDRTCSGELSTAQLDSIKLATCRASVKPMAAKCCCLACASPMSLRDPLCFFSHTVSSLSL